MLLGGKAIRKLLQDNIWKAYYKGKKFDYARIERTIRPNSIDVTLSKDIFVPNFLNGSPIDPKDEGSFKGIEQIIPDEGYILRQGEFLLGCTNERFDCGKPVFDTCFAPMYEGRSTCGRLGLGTHVTAGFGDYGFQGAFTLEIFNINPRPIRLYPDMRVGQCYFVAVIEPIKYEGVYSGEDHYWKPVPPKLGKEKMF